VDNSDLLLRLRDLTEKTMRQELVRQGLKYQVDCSKQEIHRLKEQVEELSRNKELTERALRNAETQMNTWRLLAKHTTFATGPDKEAGDGRSEADVGACFLTGGEDLFVEHKDNSMDPWRVPIGVSASFLCCSPTSRTAPTATP